LDGSPGRAGHGRRGSPRLAPPGGREAVPGPPGRERSDPRRGRLSTLQRAPRFLRQVPDTRPADLPAVDLAHEPGAVVEGGYRALAGRLRDRDGRTDLDGAAVVDGLPGAADLRPGRDRGRARAARSDR